MVQTIFILFQIVLEIIMQYLCYPSVTLIEPIKSEQRYTTIAFALLEHGKGGSSDIFSSVELVVHNTILLVEMTLFDNL